MLASNKSIIIHNTNQRKLGNLLLFVNYILFCTFPLISCATADNRNSLDATSEHRKQLFLPIYDESFNEEQLNSDEDPYKSDEEVDEHPQQQYASYHESYVTEHTVNNKMRQNMTSQHDTVAANIPSKDYNDFLQDIRLEPIDKSNGANNIPSIYEKKYFDYLPAEGVSMNDVENQQPVIHSIEMDTVDDDDNDDDNIGDDDGNGNNDHDANDYDSRGIDVGDGVDVAGIIYDNTVDDVNAVELVKPVKELLMKNVRNEHQRHKRDTYNNAVATAAFLNAERRRAGLGVQPLAVLNANIMYKWHNQLLNGIPRIDRYYLPVPPPAIIEIPGIYHNAPYPPDNIPERKNPPNSINNNNKNDNNNHIGMVENRFGEDDDGRTSPPLIHNINNANDPVLPWEQSVKVNQAPPRQMDPIFVYPEDEQNGGSRFSAPKPPLLSTTNTGTNYSPIIFSDISDYNRPLNPNNDFFDFERSPIWNTQFRQNTITTKAPSSLIWPMSTSSRQTIKSNRLPSATRQMTNPPIQRAPPTKRPIFKTTIKPITMATKPIEPSRCVWAIVSCCQRGNTAVRNKCFEQVGCYGPFWELNPCADDAYAAALAETDKFYNTR